MTWSLMKSLSAALVLLLSAGATATFAGVDADEVMASHPLASLDGERTTLSAFRGEVVVVNFWASWCTPCRPELRVMNGWNRAWAGRGARVVAISIDNDLRNAVRFVEAEKLSLTVLYDGPEGLMQRLDLPSLPCTFVLDRAGKVVKAIYSSSNSDLESVEHEVQSRLSPTGTPAPRTTANAGGTR